RTRPALAPQPRPERIPLSLAQQRMWFLNRYDPESAAYNVPLAVRLSGELDTSAMAQAVRDVVIRHESIRTVFPAGDDGPYQSIRPADEVLGDLAPVDVAAGEIAGVVRDFALAPFDVTAQAPLRVALYRIAPDEHVLAFVVHHIVGDGSSTAPLARDVMVAYLARSAGSEPGWAPLQVQYADFAIWQRSLLGAEDDPASLAAQQVQYWQSTLAGLPEVLDLPTDRPRPADRSQQGASVGFELDARVHDGLRNIASEGGATMFMVVHAALATLLARLSSSSDIAIGTPIAGRGERALDDLIGMFVNTLVLRTQVEPDAGFADLLSQTRGADLGAFANADLPFERLVDILDPVRSSAHSPLFQVVLSTEDIGEERFELPGLTVTGLADDTHVEKFDLELSYRERFDDDGRPAGLALTFGYATDIFDESSVRAFSDRLTRILAAVAADARVRIGDIELLEDAEIEALAPVRGAAPAGPATLAEMLTSTASANSASTALVLGDEAIGYAELDERSNRLARVLIARGAGPETVVALGMARSIDSVVAMWAIAKSGAAFLPVDPGYPADRIAHMLTDSGAVLGVTTSAWRDAFGSVGRWLTLDDADTASAVDAASAAAITDAERTAALHVAQTAYLIYTSGSTGLPKGVAVTHEGLMNFATELRERCGTRPGSRVLHFASPSFDASVLEYLLAFGAGATFVIAPTSVYGGDDLAELLRRHDVTHAFITPAALASVHETGMDQLEMIGVGGDVCPPELVARWAPGRRMFNMYGPTEATISVTIDGPLQPAEPVTIGSPNRGVEALVLDARLRPVAVGVPGELYVAGPALARGYHDRLGLSAERFVANPYGGNGARMYRTGDLVRWVEAERGLSLEYLGRSDQQVKVRGFRIELGEINAVLAAHTAVEFVHTSGHVTDGGDTLLVSYVLPSNGEELAVRELLAFAGERLPGYMVPAAIVILDEIPLTPAGKLDVRALPAPEITETAGTYVPPRTPTEEILAGVFAEVLGVSRAGSTDGFFDLGGNSLSATRVTARVNAVLGADLAVRDVFDAPTVAGLAALIDARRGSGADRPALVPVHRPHRIPLSPAQRRMWFLNQFDPESAAYNIPLAVRLTGELDVDALRAAIADVVARHETLRTVYPAVGREPHQVILPADTVPDLPVIEVSADRIVDEVTAFAARGFDVTAAPPLRMELLEAAPDERVLVVVIHHISGDGSSTAPLVRDVMVAYASRAAGMAPQWTPLPVQYADFAVWQRELLGDERDPQSRAARQLAFWTEALADLPAQIELPADRPRPRVQSLDGGAVAVTVDADTHRGLIEVARDRGASVFMVVHAALSALLAGLSGSSDIAVGTPTAGRGDAALDDLVGMFVGTLVLRAQVEPGITYAELIDQVREFDLAAFGNADIPFERLVEVLDPERSTAHSPLFQVMLSFQNLEREDLELPGLTVSAVGSGPEPARFDLSIGVEEGYADDGSPAEIAVSFGYATALFDESTVRGFGDAFVRVLRALVADPDAAVGDAPLAGEDDRSALAAVNATGHDLVPATLADLFDAQVARTPDAEALVFEGRRLSYADFDAQANALARKLIDAGVGPDVHVALAARRSLDLLVGMYAVIKAGGAYVPVDPDHPAERTQYVLESAAPQVVLAGTGVDLEVPDGVPVWTLGAIDVDGYPDGPVTDSERLAPLRGTNIAYVIYTSGSTGRPKGVAVPHSGVVNRLAWMQSAYPLTSDDAVVQKTPSTFDVSVWEFFWPLQVGASLVIARPDGHRDPQYLADLIEAESVTTAHFVPSMLSAFTSLVEPGRVPSLRQVFCSGEALTPQAAQAFAALSPARLHNLYGPTEASVDVTFHEYTAADTVTVPIGRPVWNTRLHVLDARLNPVPIGVAGELYLAGVQLARGYVGRPDLSADRFVADPHAPGERMYRTGDLVKWVRTADGEGIELVYIGRTDFQVKLRGLRIELGEIESVLLEQPGVAQAVVLVREDIPGAAQLVGYVTAAAGESLDVDALTAALSVRLPEYMVPAVLMVLPAFPLNASGKLDRKALPAPDTQSRSQTYRAPSTHTEAVLAQLIAELLGAERVGVDDSFFTLGGDSIMAIQLVSRAKSAGILLTPRMVFEHRTVAALAVAAEAAELVTLDELPGGGVGDVPMPPIGRWMIEHGRSYSRFSQAEVLALPRTAAFEDLTAALGAVVDHHDMLRARLVDADGVTSLHVAEAGSVDPSGILTQVRYSGEFTAAASAALEAAGTRLDPWAGRMVQAVWLVGDDADGLGHLLVVVHHLAVDGVSWPILAADLTVAWGRIASGEPVQLPEVGTSFRRWMHGLADLASTDDAADRAHFWESVLEGPDPDLGSRPLDPALDLVETVEEFRVVVPDDVTDAVLNRVPEAFHGSVDDSLLTALALALVAWRAERGVDESTALVTLEGHGREEQLLPGADLSRTVGWFTSQYPVRLDVSGIDLDDAFAAGPELGRAVKAVKEQLAAVPDRGVDYGLLRRMNPETAARLSTLRTPQIGFNYLGRRAGETPQAAEQRGEAVNLGGTRNPDMVVPALLDVNAVAVGSSLTADWAYAGGVLTRDEVARLADLWVAALTALARHTDRADAGGHTPSDFDLVSVSQRQIDAWESAYGGVDDVWSLSPLQEGLVYQSQIATDDEDFYQVQMVLKLGGRVDADRLRAAGQAILDRYPNLRVAFSYDAGVAAQVVLDGVELPFRSVSMTQVPEAERDEALRRLLDDDRRSGFDLSRPPMLRFTLVEMADGDHRLAVLVHHALVDGWSTPLFLRELFVLYATHGDATHLPPARSYRDFLVWLSKQDRAQSLSVWRDVLDGVDEPTLMVGDAVDHGSSSRELAVTLDAELSQRLNALGRDRGFTMNTVVQAGWALVVSALTGRDDVVFGATVSGRPPQLDGVEEMIGLFINTLPVRVRIRGGERLEDLLARIQTEQTDLLDHHYVGMPEIQAIAGPGAGFDTLAVFESYPDVEAGEGGDIDGMTVEGLTGTDTVHYPLALAAEYTDSLVLRLKYLDGAFSPERAQGVMDVLVGAITAFAEQQTARVVELDLMDPAQRAALVPATGRAAYPYASMADM
ncbi:non-ribosomal peptide synthetase, partial [Gordonia sihwensis]|uniref:non-ribosomal peptide synthetase n=1 Tax=Gordonia sihwensis TaxID=173559 RepID=UPI0005EDA900